MLFFLWQINGVWKNVHLFDINAWAFAFQKSTSEMRAVRKNFPGVRMEKKSTSGMRTVRKNFPGVRMKKKKHF